MAKIVPSDLAPAETVTYSLGSAEPFSLGGSGKGTKKSYETTDRTVLTNAAAHPWLAVEYDEVEQIAGAFVEPSVRPEDDVLSAFGPNAGVAFDPEKIRATEEAKAAGVTDPTAINAALDQDKVVETGGVDETIAADNADTGDNS